MAASALTTSSVLATPKGQAVELPLGSAVSQVAVKDLSHNPAWSAERSKVTTWSKGYVVCVARIRDSSKKRSTRLKTACGDTTELKAVTAGRATGTAQANVSAEPSQLMAVEIPVQGMSQRNTTEHPPTAPLAVTNVASGGEAAITNGEHDCAQGREGYACKGEGAASDSAEPETVSPHRTENPTATPPTVVSPTASVSETSVF